ncbi:MAG: hypothetical protein JXQ26_05350 [Tissierellales bacterium]|nr:hypothetical protein [Tissierellales bacterium]MBN2827390.1 hypothetical protein [Tissierellales bacterium]
MKLILDTRKIFLKPPKSLLERIVLFVTLVMTFMIFFAPLQFSSMPPVEAVAISMLPAISISWGWIVLLRFLFRRSEFIKSINE